MPDVSNTGIDWNGPITIIVTGLVTIAVERARRKRPEDKPPRRRRDDRKKEYIPEEPPEEELEYEEFEEDDV